ncbi:MAG: GldG family protein [Chloroflexi bacterium]|nr:GldG family protein [Chloroflexota bacterium]
MIRQRLIEWADYFGAVGLALWVAAGILLVLGNQPTERIIALLVLGVLAFAVFIYARFGLVRAAVTSRSARYGSNTLLVTVAFIGIVGIIAFLSGRYVYRFDTTANQQFTLSQMTTQVLQGLKEPVNAVAFFSTQSDPTQMRDAQDRLNEYKNINPDKFNYKFVDPDAEPQVAIDYNVQVDGTIVFERGKRRENVFQTDEQSLTNALFKVSQDTQPTIYFTTGHGEHSLDDSGDNGYSSLKGGLETNNYKTAMIDLKTVTETMPSDITALVIGGPVSPFDPAEVQKIKDYLGKNGRVLFMLDPNTQSGLENLIKEYGVTVRNDQVYDPKFGSFGRPQVPVINSYSSSQVTQNLTGQSSFFPGIRSLSSSTSPSYTVTSLFASSDASWGETDFGTITNQTAKYDDGKDAKGPLNLAYTVETMGETPMRFIVIGNSSFISNANLRVRGVTSTGSQVLFGNGLLFINTIRWFSGQEKLIAIPPKTTTQPQIFLTAEQNNFVFFSSVILLPLAILIIGALVWWRRR